MKTKITLIFLLLSCNLFAQNSNKVVFDDKGKAMLLGKTDKNAFKHNDFDWFQKNYANYLTNNNVINQCKDSLLNYTIKVFYGSWCGDSKRELPRFYKVLDEAKFNYNNIEVIAVDKSSEAYKTSPNGEEKGLNIHRVPTFIFYKKEKEVARIVEYPKQDFERDILTIIQGEKYTSNYNVVSYVNRIFKEKGIDEFKNNMDMYVAALAEYTKGSRELNTYGYKLLRSNQLDKALLVFELNTKMYPYKYNVFDSYAEALYKAKEYEKAIQNYAQALSLNSKHTEVLETISTIKKEIETNK